MLRIQDGNSYTQSAGNTTVTGTGVLQAANVDITGGTLQGTGTVIGVVNNNNGGGAVAGGQGFTIGALNIQGGYNQDGTGALETYITGNGQNSLVEVHSPVTLDGGVLQANTNFTLAAGQSFTVMEFDPGSLNGLFDSLEWDGHTGNGTNVDLGNGLTLGALYNDNAGNIELQVVNTPASTAANWNGGTGTWSTGGGWDTGAVPTFTSDVGIGLTGSGEVTLNQDATINSLVIHNGNGLVYQAAIPATLTVGADVSVESSGGLALGTSGDKLAVGGTFDNAGFTGLAGGTSLKALGSATNQSGGLILMQGGSLIAGGLTNEDMIAGFGTLAPVVSNNGLVWASGGTLVADMGIAGAAGFVQTDAGATLDLGADSSTGTLTNNGTLALDANTIAVSTDYTNAGFGVGNAFDHRANVSGTGEILATGDVAIALTGAGISNGQTTTPTLALGNVHVGTTTKIAPSISTTRARPDPRSAERYRTRVSRIRTSA